MVTHQAGPYGVKLPNEVPDIAHYGFTLAVMPYQPFDSVFGQMLQRYHLNYLDMFFWSQIRNICPATNDCSLSAEEENDLLNKARLHLQEVKNNPNIAGFWILDDYPGNVKSTLIKIHDLVREANLTSSIQRPTVCGFGARLDYKANPEDRGYTKSHHYFRRSLENFSPEACDGVALYLYGENKVDDPQTIDWSMSDVLPYAMVALKRYGWDPNRQPLIGLTQAFAYRWKSGEVNFVKPRYQDILTQTEAYCKWGASAIIFYAWDDSVAETEKIEAVNSEEMRRAMKDGVSICKEKYWGRN